jgi:hypothetical protein
VTAAPNSFVSFYALFYRAQATVNPMSMFGSRWFKG